MSAHEQFADDLALLARGTLQGEERVALEKHLEGCAACSRELERLRGDADSVAAREPLGQKIPARRRSSSFLPWLAAAAFLLLAGFFFRQSDRLAQRAAHLQNESAQQQAQLERAREVVSTLTSTEAMRVTLVAGQAPPQPQGRTIYVRDRSSLIFLASNLPGLPPQKAYELWLIPTNGAPIPAGVFKPDARGSASVIEPPLPGGVEAKAFAITVEPEQGSATPTMPIVMMGAGE